MNVKNMTKEQALEQMELLKKRIDFNNKLNTFVRKFRKENSIGTIHDKEAKVKFNGFWDEPTTEMKQAMIDILTKDKLGDLSWMPQQMKKNYAQSTSAIFGQVYSPAVNTYVLKDLHDCEKFLATFDKAVEKGDEENDLFKGERDTNENRLNLYFDSIPETEVREKLKHFGFRWSPSRSCWTRQLTQEAENSLARLKKELEL